MSPNRLAEEASPYLRQHRDNPVDWFPWGEEAFAEAKRRDVPILLSVGYSACHWCHVMAHESFEDRAVAAVMNELFVNVKVDREERPDVDAIYMDAVQALSGSGGWPMTVFLFPDGRPFFGGTYFPPRRTHGRPGFVELMQAITEAWTDRRSDLDGQATELTEAIQAKSKGRDDEDGEATVSPALLEGAYRVLKAAHDDEWGGFGNAPKFPQPTFVELLLRAHARNGSEVTLALVRRTLDAMAAGGIYDHLGGGFSRYSVERTWTVPHFEKMLYDQAGLLRLYVHGALVTGDDDYRQVAAEIVEYVLRDLQLESGGLASAEDADSEGVEGKFYVWSRDEVRAVGGQSAVDWYEVTPGGNFEGSNILRRPVGADLLRPAEIEAARVALLTSRSRRVRPGLDDKVLTEWNAMFVSALAEAGAGLREPEWLDAAETIADFLLANLRRDDGRWMRSWQAEVGARHLAYAVDYAWLVDAFTRLAEATGHARWIAEATTVAHDLIRLFTAPDGGFFTTADDGEALIARQRDTYDGATASANSVAALALLRLGALTGDADLQRAGEDVLNWLAPSMAAQPAAHTHALAAVDFQLAGATEIVITGDRPDLVAAARTRFLPNAVVAWGEPYGSALWEGRGDGLAYVCRDFACQQPVDSAEALLTQLSS